MDTAQDVRPSEYIKMESGYVFEVPGKGYVVITHRHTHTSPNGDVYSSYTDDISSAYYSQQAQVWERAVRMKLKVLKAKPVEVTRNTSFQLVP